METSYSITEDARPGLCLLSYCISGFVGANLPAAFLRNLQKMQLVARKISLPNKTFVCVSMWVVVLAHGYGRGELLRVVRPSGFTAVLIRSQNIGNSVVSGRPAVVGYFSSIPKTVRRRFVSLVCQLSEDRQNAPGSQSPGE